MDRRAFLRATGLLSAGVIGSLARCPGQEPPDNGDSPYVPTEPNYQGWFENVSIYRGTVDARGQDEQQVEVGVRGANGYYYFVPPAIAVSPGTIVTWVWTGRGVTHNIVSTSGAFTSSQLVEAKGHIFTHTFDNPGVFRYIFNPHQPLGMKGSVFVSLGQLGGNL